ncbi:hypothetical protein PPYR_12022 [Photinus pyralis]|uniref:IkappaB kinase n=1 Tax=Photinus pyralis TaxID=7054 RepID=A0A5N4ACX6_PHOPY|nr:inhibitor of nuclear factor kappa-B kinase subunit alpha-like isoform X1 [Photinus pyralis]XP_031351380.1 inhibitor of nuclear factor kappa-B kinase subunit alpha-like isoform X1 [Photinus pyralis]KAB0795183.1 hypothetical protein PPYR_12022 [Photinus pyralis]
MFKQNNPSTLVDINGEPTSVGDWKREKELGSGGFGVVHLWLNKTTGDSLAIKKCKWNLESHLTEKQRERWKAEVGIMEGIRNENIVAYCKMPEDLQRGLSYYSSQLPLLSMEYCRLGNLRSVLVKPENCCGLREMEILCIISDLVNALKYLHKLNVIHRDIKPENVVLQLCDTRPRGVIYKLIDLGYAKEIDSETASFVGTLQYLAPEIFIKQKCTKTVDYWSLGIVIFEIICGIRPFLHTFTPWQSLAHLEKKPSDVIAIQLTYNGRMEFFTQLFKENHINMCLAHLIEKWLQIALEFSPDLRGSYNHCDYIFAVLEEILLKKIIMVYSVYTCEFLSYEINESTLLSTVQGWIGRDTKIPIMDQCIAATQHSDSIYAIGYYNKESPITLFVFNRCAPFASITTQLPALIKILFENCKTEFKFGTIKQLYAHTAFFVLREMRLVSGLKFAITSQFNCLQTIFDKCNLQYAQLREVLKKFLCEVEVYNYQDLSLSAKVYEDTNYSQILEQFDGQMRRFAQVVEIFNKIVLRREALLEKFKRVEAANRVAFRAFHLDKFESLVQGACDDVNAINMYNPSSLTGGSKIFKIVSDTLKLKDLLLRDSFLVSYLRCVSYCWKELEKLNSCMAGLGTTTPQLTLDLRQLQAEKLSSLSDMHRKKANRTQAAFNGVNVLEENVAIRYRFQELMDAKFRRISECL